jgi:hypothetical protein
VHQLPNGAWLPVAGTKATGPNGFVGNWRGKKHILIDVNSISIRREDIPEELFEMDFIGCMIFNNVILDMDQEQQPLSPRETVAQLIARYNVDVNDAALLAPTEQGPGVVFPPRLYQRLLYQDTELLRTLICLFKYPDTIVMSVGSDIESVTGCVNWQKPGITEITVRIDATREHTSFNTAIIIKTNNPKEPEFVVPLECVRAPDLRH